MGKRVGAGGTADFKTAILRMFKLCRHWMHSAGAFYTEGRAMREISHCSDKSQTIQVSSSNFVCPFRSLRPL